MLSKQTPALSLINKPQLALLKRQLKILLDEAAKFAEKDQYSNQIRAAFYYQVALAFCDQQLQENEDKQQIKESISKAITELADNYPKKLGIKLTPETDVYAQPLKNNYKEQLKKIREETKQQFGNHQPLQLVQTPPQKLDEAKNNEPASTIQEIYQTITDKMKKLTAELIESCINDYRQLTGDNPPCDYAFICLGSMARAEMTPYSDLEYGILIAESEEKYKQYFRYVTQLLHLKMVNLCETTPKIMDITLPLIDSQAFPVSIPNGFSFDGQAKAGCKNPLGNRGLSNVNKEDLFELIGTPKELLEYQSDSWFIKNQHLSLILTCIDHICGNETLTNQYKKLLQDFLDKAEQPTETANNGKSRRRVRAAQVLYFDLLKFEPKLGKITNYGREVPIKYELYRLLNTILDGLSLFNGLNLDKTWLRLQGLSKKGFLNATDAEFIFQKILEPISTLRLNTYLENGEQNDNGLIIAPQDYADIEIFSENPIIDIFKQLIVLSDLAWEFIKSGFSKRQQYNPFEKIIYPQEQDYVSEKLIQARIYSYLRREDQATIIYQELLKQQKLAITDQITIRNQLGLSFIKKGEQKEALSLYRDLLHQISDDLKTQHPAKYISLLINLASAQDECGQYEPPYQTYSEVNNQLNNKNTEWNHLDHITILINYYLNFGIFLQKVFNHSEAIIYFGKLINLYETNIDSSFLPNIANYKSTAAVSYTALGKFNQALKNIEEAIATLKQIFGSQHPNVAVAYTNKGKIFADMGLSYKAIEYYNNALKIYAYNRDNYSLEGEIINLHNLADSYREIGKYQKSIEFSRSALELFKFDNHPYQSIILNTKAETYFSYGNSIRKDKNKKNDMYKKSLALFEKAESILPKDSHTAHLRKTLLVNKAKVFLALEQVSKAEIILKNFLDKTEPKYLELDNCLLYGSALNTFANIPNSKVDINSLYQKLITMLHRYFNNVPHPKIATVYSNYGTFLLQKGEYNQAKSWFLRALKIYKNFETQSSFLNQINCCLSLSKICDIEKTPKAKVAYITAVLQLIKHLETYCENNPSSGKKGNTVNDKNDLSSLKRDTMKFLLFYNGSIKAPLNKNQTVSATNALQRKNYVTPTS